MFNADPVIRRRLVHEHHERLTEHARAGRDPRPSREERGPWMRSALWIRLRRVRTA